VSRLFRLSPLAALLLLTACVTVPEGPSLMALPGNGKSFDQFRADDYECRQYAQLQIGGSTPAQAANDSAVKSAVVGTLLGAAAGAAINGSSGAGIGAGAGLLFGSMAGAGAGQSSAYGLQRRYDHAYVQCMYAKGDRVPVSGRVMSSQSYSTAPPPPPPPPGPPPPPPPR
jgi:outer membrane lipoprotein SlyB